MCGELLNNSHIFKCKNLNKDINKYDIKYILNGYTKEKKSAFKNLEIKFEKKRGNTQDPVVITVEPLIVFSLR